MDLLPLRAAAGGGSVNGIEASRLVAAGFTLLQRSAPLVRALAGKRAAVLLPTTPQFLTALAASDGRGVVLVNPLAAPMEIAHQLQDAQVGAVFTTAAMQGRVPAHLPRVLLDEAPTSALFRSPGGDEQRIDLGTHFGLDLEGDADAPGRDEECAIVYTSAMAGTPLGAVLTHRNLLANATQTIQAAANTAEDHVLAVLPFSHLFGLTVSLVAPLMAGARVTTMPRFNPIAAVDLIERDGITEVVGVPAVFAAMLQAIARRGGRLTTPALRLCICGGAPLDVTLQTQWEMATGVPLRQGYGLTEASPVALFNRVSEPNAPGTLGLPFPGVRISIRDEATRAELPAGTEGEICVAGETVFRGYLGFGEVGVPGSMRPVSAMARAQSIGLRTIDGWLYTGDRGRLREDGRVQFTGVIKPMFTRNGFNIYPAEIERVVGTMPGVAEVRASALPDPARENDIGLDITATSGVTEAEVRAWCEPRLAQYKQPSRITIAQAPQPG
jgi:long-chain acyl-CoA synthetase